MNKEKIKVKVIFRVFEDVFEGEVIALFPEVLGSNDSRTCNSYMHLGQHGCADYRNTVEHSRAATPKEYAELAAELRGVGYELEIKTRDARAAMEKVRRAELAREMMPATKGNTK